MLKNNNADTEEILDAIKSFANQTEQRFQKLESDVSGLKSDVSELKGDVNKIKATMVTKDYFDEKLTDKLADWRGDIVVLVRKEDHKLEALVKIISQKSLITDDEAKTVLTLEPFAKLIVS